MKTSYCLVCTKMKPRKGFIDIQFNEGVCSAGKNTKQGKNSLGVIDE